MGAPFTVLLDPTADPRWARLVSRNGAGSIFHHPAWLALLRSNYRYRLAAVCVLDSTAEPVAGIPFALVSSRLTGRRLVALPFSDSCPPLVTEGVTSADRRALAGALEFERSRRGLSLEVRAPFPELGEPVESFHAHVVDLRSGLSEVEGRYASQVRRNIRKAERLGVVVDRRTDETALDTFYDLHVRTRRRLGVPTQSKAFIRSLGDLFVQGLGFVAIARFENRAVAAAVFLAAGRTLTYKYGASDERFQHARPNNLLFSTTIRWGCDAGLETLDLGRTDLGHEGLRAFKRSWGAREEQLAYTYRGKPTGRGGGRSASVAATFIRKGPPLLGRTIGRVLYPHVG